MKRVFLIVLPVLFLLGCTTSSRSPVVPAEIGVAEKTVSLEASEIRVDIKIPVIEGLPNLALQTYLNASIEGAAIRLRDSMTIEAKEFAKEVVVLKQPLRPYQLFVNYKVTSNNARVLSFYTETYSFFGGAHGMTERKAYNIDIARGRELRLTDFFDPGVDHIARINAQILKEMRKRPKDFFWGRYMRFKTIADDQPFFVLDGVLVIYFPQTEIAPYAMGIPEFRMEKAKIWR